MILPYQRRVKKWFLIGLLLFVVAFPLLFWNKGQVVKMHKTLKEGGGAVVSFSASNLSAIQICMPRKAIIDTACALHHIILRGIERRKIFWDDAVRDSFVNPLGQVLIELHTDCFAWSLIPDHVYLLLHTGLTKPAWLAMGLLRNSIDPDGNTVES